MEVGKNDNLHGSALIGTCCGASGGKLKERIRIGCIPRRGGHSHMNNEGPWPITGQARNFSAECGGKFLRY